MTKQKTKMITIVIPLDLHEKAKKEKVNMSAVSRKAIEIYINNSEHLSKKLRDEL